MPPNRQQTAPSAFRVITLNSSPCNSTPVRSERHRSNGTLQFSRPLASNLIMNPLDPLDEAEPGIMALARKAMLLARAGVQKNVVVRVGETH